MDISSRINEALGYIKKEDYKSAEEIYLKLLAEQPENPILLSFCAYLYMTEKRYEDAEELFEKGAEISKSNSILSGLANIKYILRKYQEAVPLFINLIKQEPKNEYYEKLTNSFSNLIALGKNQYTQAAYEYAFEGVKKFPLDKTILLNFSIACLYSGHFAESEKYCSLVLKQDSKYPAAWSHLGLIKECLYCDEKGAQECYKKAIEYGIGHSGYYDLGVSYSKTGDFELAHENLEKALELLPNNETVMLAIAHNYFRQRNFELGYQYYTKQNDSSGVRNLKNIWDGLSHQDKTIFVYPDLAYGDHIMFMRYVPFLKDKFKSVKVFVYPQLKRFFEGNFDVEFVENIPDYDYSAALSKLPYYLDMDFSNIPASNGYLNATPADIKSDKLKIGICWEAGNSDLRTTIHRSVSIKEFSPIFDDRFEIYSFQVNSSSDDYLKYNLTDLGKGFKDFADTASALKSMDVLVSVDTSVANLAGALGVRTFMLLPYYADWRWFDNIETTEWYESVKIFKQTCKNSWENEFQRIYQELTLMIKK